VLTRRPPHPGSLTGTPKPKLPLTWLKAKQSMISEHERRILMWAGMNLGNRKMVQYNGFPNRFLELVRIFTVRLMMAR
jgi:hypothetical protein